jgi:hypothetical protein
LFQGQVIDFIGGRSRIRTYDPLIKSQLLCQLSYAPGHLRKSVRNVTLESSPYIDVNEFNFNNYSPDAAEAWLNLTGKSSRSHPPKAKSTLSRDVSGDLSNYPTYPLTAGMVWKLIEP